MEFVFRGIIHGAAITDYMLEKSRIVTQSRGERNYHVFYEMLRGIRPELKEKFGLSPAKNYFYLNQVDWRQFRNSVRLELAFKRPRWPFQSGNSDIFNVYNVLLLLLCFFIIIIFQTFKYDHLSQTISVFYGKVDMHVFLYYPSLHLSLQSALEKGIV